MKAAELEVFQDSAGNLIGTRRGTGSGDRRAIATGSHTDTVRGGGRFDGIVGVLGAIEAARRLRETGTELQHDLVIIDFLGEEISEFETGCIGSQALANRVPNDYFELRRDDGKRFVDALSDVGLSPDGLLGAGWNGPKLDAFVELHIEQGPVLERHNDDIGVVTAIAGIELLTARFAGRPDHAGTTPMTERHDALAAAAASVLKVEQMGCSGDQTVATVGRVQADSGGTNIVPSSATFWAEMRSTSAEWIGTARAQLAEQITAEANSRGVDVNMKWMTDEHPVSSTPDVQDVIADSAKSLGHKWRSMPSGAGHDAAFMAELAPMGMIFVPSKDGRSHCADEWTDIEAIGKGVHLLASTLVDLDRKG